MKRFFWYGISEKGPFRRLNEDYFRCVELEESHYFLSIADGVGGHAWGDLASKLATDFLPGKVPPEHQPLHSQRGLGGSHGFLPIRP